MLSSLPLRSLQDDRARCILTEFVTELQSKLEKTCSALKPSNPLRSPVRAYSPVVCLELLLRALQSGFVVAATLLGVFGFLNSLFDGKTVAKLPFVPPPFFQVLYCTDPSSYLWTYCTVLHHTVLTVPNMCILYCTDPSRYMSLVPLSY